MIILRTTLNCAQIIEAIQQQFKITGICWDYTDTKGYFEYYPNEAFSNVPEDDILKYIGGLS